MDAEQARQDAAEARMLSRARTILGDERGRSGWPASSDYYYRRAELYIRLAEYADECANAEAPKWSSEWPTEPGWYWFYGSVLGQDWPSRLLIVELEGDCYIAHTTMNRDFYRDGPARGVWLPIQTPELPAGQEETDA